MTIIGDIFSFIEHLVFGTVILGILAVGLFWYLSNKYWSSRH